MGDLLHHGPLWVTEDSCQGEMETQQRCRHAPSPVAVACSVVQEHRLATADPSSAERSADWGESWCHLVAVSGVLHAAVPGPPALQALLP